MKMNTRKAGPTLLIKAMTMFSAERARAVAVAAWRTTAQVAAQGVGREPSRASRAAVKAGLAMARAANGGRLPRGLKAAVEPYLAYLAAHVLMVRRGRPAAAKDEYPARWSGQRRDAYLKEWYSRIGC